jgi:hypothetical protein
VGQIDDPTMLVNSMNAMIAALRDDEMNAPAPAGTLDRMRTSVSRLI